MVVLFLLALLAIVAIVAVVAILARSAPETSAREAPRPAPPGNPGTATPTRAAAALPPIPAFPSPAHRLRPGVYMFGQLWRWDGSKWTAEIGDDCEPVMAIFDTPMLGTCAVTWDSVHRRTTPGGPWAREYRSPNGRPRLGAGWGHPVHGLFAGGDRGTILHSRGDGTWTKLPVPEALRGVVSALWGDDHALYVGLSGGQIARSAWGSSGEWQIQETPSKDFIFDGVSTSHGQYAVSQSGEVLFQQRTADTSPAPWVVATKLEGAARGLFADASGRVWASSRGGVVRSDQPGSWVKESTDAKYAVDAIASNGAVTWGGGERTVLQRRDAGGQWTATLPGKSGSIVSLWVGPGQELLVGTEFMLEVSEGGRGQQAETLASVNVAT